MVSTLLTELAAGAMPPCLPADHSVFPTNRIPQPPLLAPVRFPPGQRGSSWAPRSKRIARRAAARRPGPEHLRRAANYPDFAGLWSADEAAPTARPSARLVVRDLGRPPRPTLRESPPGPGAGSCARAPGTSCLSSIFPLSPRMRASSHLVARRPGYSCLLRSRGAQEAVLAQDLFNTDRIKPLARPGARQHGP